MKKLAIVKTKTVARDRIEKAFPLAVTSSEYDRHREIDRTCDNRARNNHWCRGDVGIVEFSRGVDMHFIETLLLLQENTIDSAVLYSRSTKSPMALPFIKISVMLVPQTERACFTPRQPITVETVA